jgi:predicted aspartyl protease
MCWALAFAATASAQSPAHASRAAMLIATADNPQRPVVSIGSTTWSLIPPAPGQPATIAVKANAEIPDLKMHATMTLRKNTDPTLQATHTIDLKFSFADGAPITGFKDVGLPQMRKEDSTAAEALTSAKVKISDTYFLIALAKGDSDTARNLGLMKTRAWFDFPLLLNDDRIAKVVFQKSPEGQAMLDKAFEGWNAVPSGSPAPVNKAREPPVPADEASGPPLQPSAELAPQPWQVSNVFNGIGQTFGQIGSRVAQNLGIGLKGRTDQWYWARNRELREVEAYHHQKMMDHAQELEAQVRTELMDYKIAMQGDPRALTARLHQIARTYSDDSLDYIITSKGNDAALKELQRRWRVLQGGAASPVALAAPEIAPQSTPPTGAPGETVVKLVGEGGTFRVPVTINGQLTLKFTVDSGAADVSLPKDVVMTLVRAGTINDADFLGKETYRLADGSTVPSQRFVIRALKVGEKTLENVIGNIAPVSGGLLLGQSFLSRFQSWAMDNQRQVLILR